MSTDLKSQLLEYGRYHEERQPPVTTEEIAAALTRSMATAPKPNYAMRRTIAALAAAAFVTAFIAVPALLFGGGEAPEPPLATEPLPEPDVATTAATVSESTTPQIEGYAQVQSLEDGTLVGLVSGSIWKSDDNGVSWTVWRQGGGIELLLVLDDGGVLGVDNKNDYSEALGPNSVVNGTPDLHVYDPGSDSWEVVELPRPDLPYDDLEPASMDPDDTTCPLGGLQSWVDGSDIAAGSSFAILGQHRLNADGICDDSFDFIWVSEDLHGWSIIPTVDVDGHISRLFWLDGAWVGVGSERAGYVGGGGPLPRVWTSTDLTAWEQRPLDLSSLPSDASVHISPENSNAMVGIDSSRLILSDGASIELRVWRFRPGIEDLTSVDDLRSWLVEAGKEPDLDDDFSLEDNLASLDVDFPLDAEEINTLKAFYSLHEDYGTLTLTSPDGSDWSAEYKP
ncbi:MAG: hypothetical protein WD274_05205 [Acidimicrobiia bacterium]